MKINPKDLLLMFIAGFLLILFGEALPRIIDMHPNDTILIMLPLSIIPGILYFYRNACNQVEAILVSLIFGFMIYPVSMFVLILGDSILRGESLYLALDLLTGFWLSLFIFSGLLFSFLTLVSYFLVAHFISKPKS